MLYAPDGTDLTRQQRPDGNRFEYSRDYLPYPLTWIPSMVTSRRERYFGDLSEYEVQLKLDGAALHLAGIQPQLEKQGASLTRFGGTPVDQQYAAPAISGHIDAAGFGNHVLFSPHQNFAQHEDRIFAFRELQLLSEAELIAAVKAPRSPYADNRRALIDLFDSGDEFVAWATDQSIDHSDGVSRWKQLLSLDSHYEIGMRLTFKYEFVALEHDLSLDKFTGRLDLCQYG